MKRYSLALDLKKDSGLIQRYEQMHKEAWPEIISFDKRIRVRKDGNLPL